MNWDFDVTGAAETQAFFEKLFPNYMDAAAQALKDWAELVMNAAVKLVPVRHGFLKNSRFVDDVVSTETQISILMGFTMSYAIYVHENLQAHHIVGQAKFLEQPLMAMIDDLIPLMLNYMRQAEERST